MGRVDVAARKPERSRSNREVQIQEVPTDVLQDHHAPSERTSTADTASAGRLRVLVVSDDALVRTALGLLLATETPDLRAPGVVARVRTDGVVDALAQIGADLVVCDLGADPERASATLASLRIEVPLIVLIPDALPVTVALAAGALGVFPRTADGETLLRAAHAVAGGLVALDATLATPLSRAARPSVSRTRASVELTPREREVLQSLAEGLANKSIAARLHISEHTVKFHVNAILAKLGADSRTDAVVRAARLGLVML